MSNLSLKEQLQALSLELPATSSEKPKFVKPDRNKKVEPKQKKSAKPAWLEQAQYGVELLKAHFPACFKEFNEIKPLKVGIKQDLVKQLSTLTNIVVTDKACMVNSLAFYVNSVAYHKSVVEGANRIDLDGNAAGVITAEEARYSEECRASKIKKKQAKKNPVAKAVVAN